MKSARREQALRDLRETNDVLSRRLDTSRMSAADREIYEEGLRRGSAVDPAQAAGREPASRAVTADDTAARLDVELEYP